MEPSLYPRQPGYVTESPDSGNLALAVVAGLVAALVGAVLWALLVSATHYKIGYAAVGVGYLVGLAMRVAGKGHTPVFGYIGAGLALLGCVVGDILTDCAIAAEQSHTSVFSVLGILTPSLAIESLKEGFGPLDILFYVLAAMAGYRNAFIKN